MVLGLFTFCLKMECSDLEVQIKMFSAIKSVEAGVSTRKISSTNWAD